MLTVDAAKMIATAIVGGHTYSDVNKDLTFKDKDKDQTLNITTYTWIIHHDHDKLMWHLHAVQL